MDFDKFWQVTSVMFQLLNYWQFATSSKFTYFANSVHNSENDLTLV